jgi:hypothetical protein
LTSAKKTLEIVPMPENTNETNEELQARVAKLEKLVANMHTGLNLAMGYLEEEVQNVNAAQQAKHSEATAKLEKLQRAINRL